MYGQDHKQFIFLTTEIIAYLATSHCDESRFEEAWCKAAKIWGKTTKWSKITFQNQSCFPFMRNSHDCCFAYRCVWSVCIMYLQYIHETVTFTTLHLFWQGVFVLNSIANNKKNNKNHIKSSFKLAHKAHRELPLMKIYLNLPPRATNPLKRSRFLAFKMSTFSPCFADLILRQIVGFS